MKLIENISRLATCADEGGQGEIHEIPDAAMVWEGATIRWVGPKRDLPRERTSSPGASKVRATSTSRGRAAGSRRPSARPGKRVPTRSWPGRAASSGK